MEFIEWLDNDLVVYDIWVCDVEEGICLCLLLMILFFVLKRLLCLCSGGLLRVRFILLSWLFSGCLRC